jgi:hypothetical protein
VGVAELPLALMELLANPAERAALGQRAAATLRSQSGTAAGTTTVATTGATQRTLKALENLLSAPRETD